MCVWTSTIVGAIFSGLPLAARMCIYPSAFCCEKYGV